MSEERTWGDMNALGRECYLLGRLLEAEPTTEHLKLEWESTRQSLLARQREIVNEVVIRSQDLLKGLAIRFKARYEHRTELDVEDLVNEGILAVAEKFTRYDGEHAASTYLVMLAKNAMRSALYDHTSVHITSGRNRTDEDEARVRAIRGGQMGRLLHPATGLEDTTLLETLVKEEMLQDELYVQGATTAALVSSALDGCSPSDRLLLEHLYELNGRSRLTHKEIGSAGLLGKVLSVKAVREREQMALYRIRKRVGSYAKTA